MKEREGEKRKLCEKKRKNSKVNGLVLLEKTLVGGTNEFGGSITGTVVSAPGSKAQVRRNYLPICTTRPVRKSEVPSPTLMVLSQGTVELQGPPSFGTRFVSFKFSELSGF